MKAKFFYFGRLILSNILVFSCLMSFASNIDTAMQFQAKIYKYNIPSFFTEDCLITSNELPYSQRTNTIVKKINSQLISGNLYYFGKNIVKVEEWESKLFWEIAPHPYSPDLIQVTVTTNTIWLGNLVEKYFKKQKLNKCFQWDSFYQKPKSEIQVYSNVRRDNDVDVYLRYLKDSSDIYNINSTQEFKFPPSSNPTSQIVLPPSFFKESNTLGEINRVISNSLESAGFLETRYGGGGYYNLPNGDSLGFVLLTRVEQFDEYGSPMITHRWNHKIEYGDFSVMRFLKHIIKAQKGYYRLFVFVINPRKNNRNNKNNRNTLEYTLARRSFLSGHITLSEKIKKQKYEKSIDHSNIFVLVYEFQCSENEKEAILIDESKAILNAKDHLIKSGIWDGLNSN